MRVYQAIKQQVYTAKWDKTVWFYPTQRVKEPHFTLAREHLYLPPGASEAINLSIASGNRSLMSEGAPVRTNIKV